MTTKVLHVISELSIGGTQTLLVNHVRRLTEAYPSFASSVCVLGSKSAAWPDYLQWLPVKPHFLEFSGRYRDPVAASACIGKLRTLIRKLNPDIVHSYLWNADVFSAVATIGLDVRRASQVVDRRGDRHSPRFSSRWRTRTTAWLLKRGKTRFAAVSEACREHAINVYSVPPGEIVTAHNGVRLDTLRPAERPIFSRQPATFGAISRLADEKGHAFLLEAFAKLVSEGCPARLKVAGAGRSLPELRALVEELGLSDRIEFLGHVESSAAFYRELDAFVVPSVEAEGLPTTILEAMATGLPVIATDVGGAAEAVRHGREGLIVPPRDSASLAAAVRSLVADPDRARAFGKAGLRRVGSEFTIERMTETIVQRVYRPMLSSEVREAELVRLA